MGSPQPAKFGCFHTPKAVIKGLFIGVSQPTIALAKNTPNKDSTYPFDLRTALTSVAAGSV